MDLARVMEQYMGFKEYFDDTKFQKSVDEPVDADGADRAGGAGLDPAMVVISSLRHQSPFGVL